MFIDNQSPGNLRFRISGRKYLDYEYVVALLCFDLYTVIHRRWRAGQFAYRYFAYRRSITAWTVSYCSPSFSYGYRSRLFFGQFILNVLSISVGSFAIAGGIILLVLSIKYMTTGRMVETIKEEIIAVVPIGTPLVVGPATITTLLILASQFPLYIVLISFIINLLITWIIFMLSDIIIKVLRPGGLKAISKVFSLLLAAIAVKMVMDGLNLVGILKIGS